jgi:WD40 repeat protein
VRLWTVPARSQPQQLGVPLRVDLGPVTALAFAPDGTTLATGSGTSEVGYDGGVLLWDIRAIRDTTADLTGIACRQALRGLTTKEWSQVVPGLDYRPSC